MISCVYVTKSKHFYTKVTTWFIARIKVLQPLIKWSNSHHISTLAKLLHILRQCGQSVMVKCYLKPNEHHVLWCRVKSQLFSKPQRLHVSRDMPAWFWCRSNFSWEMMKSSYITRREGLKWKISLTCKTWVYVYTSGSLRQIYEKIDQPNNEATAAS